MCGEVLSVCCELLCVQVVCRGGSCGCVLPGYEGCQFCWMCPAIVDGVFLCCVGGSVVLCYKYVVCRVCAFSCGTCGVKLVYSDGVLV